ncbi:Pyroglutamyl-peptidase I [Jonesia denitrificans DSM 20603]|uniref:Pyroglutamyl-peptidase I n=2 Tax=Jonesia TaxID=43673 RepID=C7R429_JONDD|nr:Pyroglutamyl-peptidase I [Jonesia denitrificans DSM 20603]ASE09800.1 pyroglutamyl-peptidase I [Jonesia denitrificans]SQH20889.1 Pyrrolidone-carboxylate peptidase [Jonesia denitrificans]
MILMTSFEPFDGDTYNPSMDVVAFAEQELITRGHHVVSTVLPCAFDPAQHRVWELMERWKPALTVNVGVAAGRPNLTIERVAINLIDARIPDNHGNQPVDKPVVVDGPAAYFTRFPIKRAISALQAQGHTAEVSYSAGTYVCNHVMYSAAHALTRVNTNARSVFVHVPMPDADSRGERCARDGSALVTLAETGLTHTTDIPHSAGTLW